RQVRDRTREAHRVAAAFLIRWSGHGTDLPLEMAAMVDIKRDPPKKTKRNVLIGAALAGVALITVMLSQLEARPTSVARAELWVDSVQRGLMLRQGGAPATPV